jgi:ABC-type branched-subunit amino acid transport system ATPase component
MTDTLASANHDKVSDAALEVRNLSKSFGGIAAVNQVSFTVPRGEFYGIIGPNGSGKSTLVDCISGMLRMDSGSVILEGADISRLPLHRIASLGLLRTFQVSRLFEEISVLSNVMVAAPDQDGQGLWRASFGRWRAKQAESLEVARDLLKFYELTKHEDELASTLSGGQRRLLELARLSIRRPKVILLDEPFAGVSPVYRTRIVELLRSLVSNGVTIVMVEHRLDLVEQLCDHIIVMAEGSIIGQGLLSDLRRDQTIIDAYLGEVHDHTPRM